VCLFNTVVCCSGISLPTSLFRCCIAVRIMISVCRVQHALWSDLFTGRLKTEIPDALVRHCFNHSMFACAAAL